MVQGGAVLVPIVACVLGGALSAQITTRSSENSSGNQALGGASRWPSITGNGLVVAFESDATNLVPSDTNGTTDIFVHDHGGSGNTTRVSRGPNNTQLLGISVRPSISADGRFVAYTYVEPAGSFDAVFYDRITSQTYSASAPDAGGFANGNSGNAVISGDSNFIAFTSTATNLVAIDTSPNGDCFLRDRLASTLSLVSCDSAGIPGNGSSDFMPPAVSADGRFVVFASNATNLDPADTNQAVDLFLRDTQAGTTELVTIGNPNGSVAAPSISADGRYVAFASDAAFDPADTNSFVDVYVRDRQLGVFVRISVGAGGAQSDASSGDPAISAGGRYVTFASHASNLVSGDANAASDVFVRDLQGGTTSRASIGTFQNEGNGDSVRPAISADGMRVAFQSAASTLVGGDTNALEDVIHTYRRCFGSLFTYCTAKVNSLGCTPSIGALGLPSLSGADNFRVRANQVLNRKLGLMLWSLAPDDTPFFGGTLCLAQPLHRTPGQDSGGSPTGDDCTGTYSYPFTQAYMLQHGLAAGTTVYAQYWMRDPGFPVPDNIGLTNGLRFTICP